MKSGLKKIISEISIGGVIFSSCLAGELDSKITMNKNQERKVAIFNREINDDIMSYSLVEHDQKLIYETNTKNISFSEQNTITDYLEDIGINKTNTLLDISRDDSEKFIFTYKNEGRNDLSDKERERIPNYEEFFREDTKNTHIYFIYPPGSKLEIISQSLEVLNNKTELTRTLDTKSYKDTEFYNTASKVSDFLDLYNLLKLNLSETETSRINNLGYNHESIANLGIERILFNYLPEDNPQVKLAKKIPGKTGKILKGIIFLSKTLMNEVEKQNKLKILNRGLSKDWNVKKMPFLVADKLNFFQDNIISRETSFSINGNYDKFYILVSSLPYITGMTRTQTSGIEDVLIEIKK